MRLYAWQVIREANWKSGRFKKAVSNHAKFRKRRESVNRCEFLPSAASVACSLSVLAEVGSDGDVSPSVLQ